MHAQAERSDEGHERSYPATNGGACWRSKWILCIASRLRPFVGVSDHHRDIKWTPGTGHWSATETVQGRLEPLLQIHFVLALRALIFTGTRRERNDGRERNDLRPPILHGAKPVCHLRNDFPDP